MDKLRFANEREEQASQFIQRQQVKLDVMGSNKDGVMISGSVLDKKTENASVKLDLDEVLISAQCSCNWYFMNQLRKGPCQHILALRLAAKQGRE